MRVVTVCTANMCRSPFAEHALRRAFVAHGLDIGVVSTGVDSHPGRRAPSEWSSVASEFGVDLQGHRTSDADDALEGADLVLAMTSEHLRAVIVGWPHLLGKVVTFGEAVRRAEWGVDQVSDLVAARTGGEVLMTSNAEDVPDPMGRSRRVQRAVAGHLTELSERLAAAWPTSAEDPPEVPA